MNYTVILSRAARKQLERFSGEYEKQIPFDAQQLEQAFV